MSTSALSGSYANRGRSHGVISASAARHTASRPATIDAHAIFAQHTASEWLGQPGEQLRFRGRVESVTSSSPGTFTHLVRAEETNDLVEWTTRRRYGIVAGDRLALAGRVKAHVTRDDARVTVLRDCFNPLRMA